MQCFQKDPNLRVSARKLLKHPWIGGCRRSDAPVSKRPADFNQAVEEVKQWNEALKSSKTSLRASSGSDGSAPPQNGQPVSRFGAAAADPQRTSLATPAGKKPSLTFSKPKPNPDQFRSPEIADDDNWDNDFATSISPSALHLPHLKPQDNFGGMLSADRLKQFASIDESSVRDNWDDNFEGDLQTVKQSRQIFDQDPQEQTIRPTPRRSSKSAESSKQQHGHKRSRSKQVSNPSVPLLPKSPKPPLGNKFELPLRPEAIYREQSTEDFSDLFPDNENLFGRKMSRARKVSSHVLLQPRPRPSIGRISHSYFAAGFVSTHAPT